MMLIMMMMMVVLMCVTGGVENEATGDGEGGVHQSQADATRGKGVVVGYDPAVLGETKARMRRSNRRKQRRKREQEGG